MKRKLCGFLFFIYGKNGVLTLPGSKLGKAFGKTALPVGAIIGGIMVPLSPV